VSRGKIGKDRGFSDGLDLASSTCRCHMPAILPVRESYEVSDHHPCSSPPNRGLP
jgi:hypothetical protein